MHVAYYYVSMKCIKEIISMFLEAFFPIDFKTLVPYPPWYYLLRVLTVNFSTTRARNAL